MTVECIIREKRRIYDREYNRTPAGIKRHIIGKWNDYGITFGTMTNSEFYDNVYLYATHCQSCNKVFNKINNNDEKTADHLHKKTPCNIRGVICSECNRNDAWRTRMTVDSIYQLYLKEHDENEIVRLVAKLNKTKS